MLGVCMDVIRFITIVSITDLFNFIKCVNALIETVCMNRKRKKKTKTKKQTSMHLLSIKDDLSVVWR